MIENIRKMNTLKQAMFAKLYSASDICLAKLTGIYPPPHNEIDKFMQNRLTILQNKGKET